MHFYNFQQKKQNSTVVSALIVSQQLIVESVRCALINLSLVDLVGKNRSAC